MNCEWTEKVSLLMDGELMLEEAAKASAHLAACETCQEAQADFLQLRELVQDYPAPGLFAQRRALASILGAESAPERLPLWKRRIAVPAPIFALLFGAVLMLGALIVASRFSSLPKPTSPLQNQPPRANVAEDGPRSMDFSAFDRGGRAVIYVVRQPPTSERKEKP